MKNQTSNLTKFGIPKLYEQAEIDKADLDKDAIKFLKSYINSYMNGKTSRGLYLFGPEGAGKTYVSCAIMRYCLLQGVYSFRITSQRLGEEYFKNFSIPTFAGGEGPLVVEDLGQEAQNIKKSIGSIIRYVSASRVENRQPIVVTSSYNLKDLSRVYMNNMLEDFLTSNFFKIGVNNSNKALLLKDEELKTIKGE